MNSIILFTFEFEQPWILKSDYGYHGYKSDFVIFNQAFLEKHNSTIFQAGEMFFWWW